MKIKTVQRVCLILAWIAATGLTGCGKRVGSSRCTPYGRTPLTEFRTCGFSASGSLRNESFTLSFVYIDIYPGSYQWIAVIQHIQKFYPIIAFLLASPVQIIEQASHDVISECRYTFLMFIFDFLPNSGKLIFVSAKMLIHKKGQSV